MRAYCFPLAFNGKIEPLSILTHPADLPGRHSGHQRIIPHVFVDHRTGSNKRVATEGYTADDGAIGPQCRTLLDQSIPILFFPGDRGAGIVHIGKHHARSAKYIVFQRHIVVDRHVVLNLDVIANPDPVTHEHILPERTGLSYLRPAADVYPVPDAGAVPDLCTRVDDGGFVYLTCHAGILQYSSGSETRRPSRADR